MPYELAWVLPAWHPLFARLLGCWLLACLLVACLLAGWLAGWLTCWGNAAQALTAFKTVTCCLPQATKQATCTLSTLPAAPSSAWRQVCRHPLQQNLVHSRGSVHNWRQQASLVTGQGLRLPPLTHPRYWSRAPPSTLDPPQLGNRLPISPSPPSPAFPPPLLLV
eukprot:355549-Chlamydomonas_euryale.AAC.2